MIIYNTPTITDRLQVVVSHIDGGGSAGTMRLLTAPPTQTVGIVPLSYPSATVSGDLLTFSGLPLAAPLTLISAYIEYAQVYDSNGTLIIDGLTVGNSTAYDIVMNTNLVSSGQSVALTYATITGT